MDELLLQLAEDVQSDVFKNPPTGLRFCKSGIWRVRHQDGTCFICRSLAEVKVYLKEQHEQV